MKSKPTTEPRCRTCLFQQVCQSRTGCEGYAPCGEDEEYEALDAYIEQRRIDYHSEWRSYVPEEFD